jgi:hypothetical protein
MPPNMPGGRDRCPKQSAHADDEGYEQELHRIKPGTKDSNEAFSIHAKDNKIAVLLQAAGQPLQVRLAAACNLEHQEFRNDVRRARFDYEQNSLADSTLPSQV